MFTTTPVYGSYKTLDSPEGTSAFFTNAVSNTVDAAGHSHFAMDNNPLHTTASGGNLGPVFLGLDWAAFSLSTIIVALRLYTKLCITRNFGFDDATIALTQARHLFFH